jgi:hypothetical protein
VPLPNLTLQQLLQSASGGGTSDSSSSTTTTSSEVVLLNTCSSEVLAELLRHLKRAYWPFAWATSVDAPEQGGRGSGGGFRCVVSRVRVCAWWHGTATACIAVCGRTPTCTHTRAHYTARAPVCLCAHRAAAEAALRSDDMSAALRAVAATAAHRLQRGIWTSPGAGDISRCLAAAERLVMMVGDEQPQERRDLAVLLLHAGYPAAAAAELSAYLDSCRPSSPLRQWAGSEADRQRPGDVRLAQELWRLLRESGVTPAGDVVSVDAMLRTGGRGVRLSGTQAAEEPHKPLTW